MSVSIVMHRAQAGLRPRLDGAIAKGRFFHRWVWLALVAAAGSGCASTSGTYGDRARYSPAFGGYVMAEDNGSDDPGKHDTVLLLRDPVTGTKLRCREDVERWRELYEDVASDQVDDDNAEVAAGIATGATFGPLVAMHPIGALVLAEAMSVSGSFYDALRSDNATELLANGIVLFNRRRFTHASLLIERALAKDGTVGILDKAYLYLGLSYLELGRDDRARLALTSFVDRAGVRDVDAYRKAEAALAGLGVPRPACRSVGPVALHW